MFITIASLAIKAVEVYCKNQQQYLLNNLLEQNKKILDFEIYKYTEDKRSILRQANKFLDDYSYSSSDSTKCTLLNNAITLYTKLVTLPTKERVSSETILDNSEFICLGYYGRFCCFGMLNDSINSTIQVYECAQYYPHLAVELFDKSFFPKIDCSQLSELCENFNRIEHYESLIGIYEGIPYNMARPLVDRQLSKYKQQFYQILSILKNK